LINEVRKFLHLRKGGNFVKLFSKNDPYIGGVP
jgi:hypothetical protein